MFGLVEGWDLMIYFVFIGVLLFVSKIIKEKVPFLNKVILPTALIAGFLGLIISDGFLGLVTLDREGIIHEIVYHSLAIGFIAISLKRDKNETNKKVWSTGMIIVMTYLLQAFIGVMVVIVFFPKLFLGAGLLLPLGFGQGPGLAQSQGQSFAEGVGLLSEGAALGSTIATVGFLVGGIVGVIALNYLARKYKIKVNKIHEENSRITETFEVETIKEIRVFDTLTSQATIILVIYFAVYLTLAFLETNLREIGGIAETFAGVFHGFNFLIGILYALLFKKVLVWFDNRGKNTNFITNNYVLSNISSISFNFLIVAAVLRITREAIDEYYLLVAVMALFATVFTLLFIRFIVKKVYDEKYFVHYFLGLFGMLTGTASTGLALLKGVDPEYKSPVAEEMVVGSGTAISMALPLFALLAFPGMAITNDNDLFNYLTIGIPVIYFLILLVITLKVNSKKTSN
jgi:ESS family glutamate:Na+ symporter